MQLLAPIAITQGRVSSSNVKIKQQKISNSFNSINQDTFVSSKSTPFKGNDTNPIKALFNKALNNISFKGITSDPIAAAGLTASNMKLSEIDEFMEHIKKSCEISEYDPPLTKEMHSLVKENTVEVLTNKDGEGYIKMLRDKDGKLVGTCGLAIRSNEKIKFGGVFSFYIDPQYQGKGLGSSVLKDMIQASKDMNCSVMTLGTISPKAKSFYEKSGFEVVTIVEEGEYKGYYVMQHKLAE